MKRRLGILICGHIAEDLRDTYGHYGSFYRALLGQDTFDYQDYFVVDNDFPASVKACDGYLISGSAHGVYEDLLFIARLKDFIQAAHGQKIPMVGVCFGHQAMACALGGQVEKFEGGWALGRHSYEMDLGTGGQALTLQAVHQDQVVGLPPEARVIGSSDFCQYAALAYGETSVSLQPHPEFGVEFMRDLIAVRRGKAFPEDKAKTALDEMGETPHAKKVSQWMVEILNREIA